MATSYEELEKMAKTILERVHSRPKIGIVCGSGLGTLAESVVGPEVISYNDLHGFPHSTVEGHAGNFVFGKLAGKEVVLMQGRIHPYEGYTTQQCTIPIRVMHLLGVHTLLLTNAAGGLNPAYNVGDMMVIKDHINFPGLAGFNPLVGHNDKRFGQRFIPLSDAYDRELRQLAHQVAKELGHNSALHEGVYAMQLGPAYETIAEVNMMHKLGGDVVGMSTTHEVIVARHMGMRVFAMSLVTNKAVHEYDSTTKANHEEVLETSRQRAEVMKAIIQGVVAKINV